MQFLLSLILLLLSIAYIPQSQATTPDPFTIILPNKKAIQVSDKKWEKASDSDVYAKNFFAKNKDTNEVYEQVITVFLMPLSKDRIAGKRISEKEWLEMWIIQDGTCAVKIRVDKGSYWVLSRQTFKTEELKGINPELSEENFIKYHKALQSSIDKTRHTIAYEF